MQSAADKPMDMIALGREWIAAWNAHDLDRVLALYTENFEMNSKHIVGFGFDPSGTLRGKGKVREYWAFALTKVPDLHFKLIGVYTSPDSVIVHYENERGGKVCEYLRFDAAGKIFQTSGNYLAP